MKTKNITDYLTPLENTALEIIERVRGKNRLKKAVKYRSHPLLQALKRVGTTHIYVDTADFKELSDLIVYSEDQDQFVYNKEIDGNTTNQPLVAKIFDSFAREGSQESLEVWVKELKKATPSLSFSKAASILYTIINGRIGIETTERYGVDRRWEISLELHTGLAASMEESFRAGWCLHASNPNCFVKVPFTPHLPHCFVIARELEKAGIAVNFTATFSARQVVAAALLANPHRSNVFIGRLSQGLESALLGEHVVLEAQRQLRKIRSAYGLQTLNIVASMRRWQTFPLTAGCDVYTAPYKALKDFLEQKEVLPENIISQEHKSYLEELHLKDEVLNTVGRKQIERLFVVEPQFIEFLLELRKTPEFETIDGEGLQKKFDQAGFGDFFYAPSALEWKELRKSKLPDLNSTLTKNIAMDTLYSLLAFGDFSNFQEKMDADTIQKIEKSF
ncbi:transaldolase [Methylacidiphilum kamchatkense Kam1]|uniref:Transaldolase n=1 Tax=Methylacidiphilum kamchatkense Kam1 TaxID=1202785 RepID=A0A0C1RIC3_9BACT|nr:transaldolase family protein [Methylacidiphilum kamchatkense]KIE57772.1 transaldolase [Methylacidiphilum kamchatkense Kam1]QDQ42482.1 transaldolase [Methylacidiphilum kamchatkense Kam1]